MTASDSGADLPSSVTIGWDARTGIECYCVAQTKPMQNGCVESFKGQMSDGLLNENLFMGTPPLASPSGARMADNTMCPTHHWLAEHLRTSLLASRQPATGNRQPATGNRQPATGNRQPATGNRQPATGNRQPATGHRAALGDGFPLLAGCSNAPQDASTAAAPTSAG
jgi:hypothetical protein